MIVARSGAGRCRDRCVTGDAPALRLFSLRDFRYAGDVPRLDPLTALAILRITTGLIAFPHGVRKLLKGPVAAIGSDMVEHGLPEAFAYVVVLGELAGLLMVVGLYSRLASAAVALTMGGVALVANWGEISAIGTGRSLGLELSLLLAIAAALCALTPSASRFALDARRRR
jgi:putative oxidoreductase